MKLNIHSPFSHLYRNFYNTTTMPNDLCSYFWKLILALITIPIVWPSILCNIKCIVYNNKFKNYWGSNNLPTVLGMFLNLLLYTIGILTDTIIYGKYVSNKYITTFSHYINGIIVSFIVLLLFWVIIKIVYYFVNKKPKKILTDEEQHEEYLKLLAKLEEKEAKKLKSFWYITWNYLKAWKEKNCPIITWNDNKEK